jgi:hypothetical protein
MDGCFGVVAAIDGDGGYHVAASCLVRDPITEIRYSTSPDGRSWTTRAFRPPPDRTDGSPKLAVDRDVVYLAFTRQTLAQFDCGVGMYDDVGVSYRAREVPSGDWSSPIRIGSRDDHLQSFEVAQGVLHATVNNNDSTRTWYERIENDAPERIRIPDAVGPVALQLGDDQRPRLAYEAKAGIRFGTVKDQALSATAIPGSDGGSQPSVAVGPGNVAFVLWVRVWHGGCDTIHPDPKDGTYLSTNAGGSWTTTRVSRGVRGAAVKLVPATGDLLVLEHGDSMTVRRLAGNGEWTQEEISNGLIQSADLEIDPVTSMEFVAYGARSANDKTGVRVRTRS